MKRPMVRAAITCGAIAGGLKQARSAEKPQDMKITYAVPNADGRFYRYCYVTEDGKREKNLLQGEWLDTQIVPGSVRCDKLETILTPIADARLLEERASLAKQGFELRKHMSKCGNPEITSRESMEKWLNEELFPQAAVLVKDAVEASFGKVRATHVIDYTLRTTDGTGADARNVVKEAHVDFTPESGIRRIENEKVVFRSGDPARISPQDRVLLVNLWQPLVDTVYRVPLAVCDTRSLAADDLVRKTMFFKGREGEVFNLKYNPRQAWYYYKHMRKEEALLFLTWSPSNKFTPHTAVEDEADAEDSPPRRSLEIRFAVRLADTDE